MCIRDRYTPINTTRRTNGNLRTNTKTDIPKKNASDAPATNQEYLIIYKKPVPNPSAQNCRILDPTLICSSRQERSFNVQKPSHGKSANPTQSEEVGMTMASPSLDNVDKAMTTARERETGWVKPNSRDKRRNPSPPARKQRNTTHLAAMSGERPSFAKGYNNHIGPGGNQTLSLIHISEPTRPY